jgi:SAM-dependent methyltransferase
VSVFGGVERVWGARLGTLRNVVRQHVIGQQLNAHLDASVQTVLDVGCGQGTQALALAAHGLTVTGVDPSAELLAQMMSDAAVRGLSVEALPGDLHSIEDVVGGRSFDLVCAHGLLMYLPDARSALAALTSRTRPGGLVSFTFRNGDALAHRPGLRGDWRGALEAFGSSDHYINELGAGARAHRLDDVRVWCQELDLDIEQWYGVRVLTDSRPAEEMPDPTSIQDCLAVVVEAGRRDPYRALGSQLHVVARQRRSVAPPQPA